MTKADTENTSPVPTKRSRAPESLIIDLDGGNVQLSESLAPLAFGTHDVGFIKGAFNQVAQLAAKNGEIGKEEIEFISGALVGINPTNTIEAMLAAQIVANHILTMKLASQTLNAKSTEAREVLEKMYTKLARTFPAQLETLHKMRHGGQQQMVVKHVNVAEGGQAIIGSVSQGGRG